MTTPVFDRPMKLHLPRQDMGYTHTLSLPDGKELQVVIDSDLYSYIEGLQDTYITLQSLAFYIAKYDARYMLWMNTNPNIPLWAYSEIPRWMTINSK